MLRKSLFCSPGREVSQIPLLLKRREALPQSLYARSTNIEKLLKKNLSLQKRGNKGHGLGTAMIPKFPIALALLEGKNEMLPPPKICVLFDLLGVGNAEAPKKGGLLPSPLMTEKCCSECRGFA
jgi:hypothetical protein